LSFCSRSIVSVLAQISINEFPIRACIWRAISLSSESR
jgi:hypothetical protein